MQPDARPAAIVLVGGASRRMGTDKASLVVNGQTMLNGVLRVLELLGVESIAVAGSAELPDAQPGEGPLAGIFSGWGSLKHAQPDPVVVLSCDLPSLNAGVVSELITRSADHDHGAVAHDGTRPQPLVAAYRPRALDDLMQAFDAGERSVRRRFPDWDLAEVFFEPASIADADTPADLAEFDVDWPAK